MLKAMRVQRWILCGAIGMLALSRQVAPAWAGQELHVMPNLVHIGSFFHGIRLSVTARIPEASDAVIELIGQASHETLMCKGRRGGLWMNVGEVDIEGAPVAYMVASNTTDLFSEAYDDAPWGYESLRKRVSIKGGPYDPSKLFREFVRMKESQGLFEVKPGILKISRSDAGQWALQGSFRLPAKIAPGRYAVCLSVIKNHRLQERKCAPFEVEISGFPALVYSLAYHHGVLYGILAVAIAIFTGFSIGFLFRGKGGGH